MMRQAQGYRRRHAQGKGEWLALFILLSGLAALLSGCSMSEEVKRIEQVNQLAERRAAASSTDLTGKQLFLRSCNTCHPGGRQGLGPALSDLSRDFPNDRDLKIFIRKGKGTMPAQPKEAVDDRELDSLVAYLRTLNQ